MSKDIWHKPIETTDIDNNLIIDDWTNGTYELGYFDDNDMIFRNLRNDDTYFEESMMRWCDVNELIDDYDRTRKALDVANEKLKHCVNMTVEELDELKGNLLIAWNALSHFSKDPIANNALKKITALEQKDVK